jgi:hypothetical protein
LAVNASFRRAHDPFALGQDAHQLAVGVHLDEPEHGDPVLVGHPVGRLDLAAGGHVLLEMAVSLVMVEGVVVEWEGRPLARRQDGIEGKRVGHRWSSERERRASST